MKNITTLIEKLGKLDFRYTVAGFVGILLVLSSIYNLLNPRIPENPILGNVESIPNFDYAELEAKESEGIISMNFVDKSAKDYSITEAMPFKSDAFNVTYEEGSGVFTVHKNPASSLTRSDIYKWFESFPGIEDAASLPIIFDDEVGSGAPTTPPE